MSVKVPVTERSLRIIERLRAYGHTDAEKLIEEALDAFYEQAQDTAHARAIAAKTDDRERFVMAALQDPK